VSMASKNGGKDNITAVVAHLKAGTRTLRMQVADLIRPAAGAAPAPNTWADDKPGTTATPPRPAPLLGALVGLLTALSLGAALWFGSLLTQVGYHFTATPPFAVKPRPVVTPAPKVLDSTHVAYASPVLLYPMPVRGDLLTVDPKDGLVTVAALSGTVVALTPQGIVRYKYLLPAVRPKAPAAAGALGANGATLHIAADPSGNLYVSDALAKTVTKYQPNGVALGLVSHLSLTNPQAIAAGADGTIYLIDAERLKVLRSKPSMMPLPPIPIPVVPKPAAAPSFNPALAESVTPPVPTAGRRYRHTGYRHYRHYTGRQF